MVGIAGVAACVAPIAEFGGDQIFFESKIIVIGTARREAILTLSESFGFMATP